jgi:hypothetical protein
MSQHSASIECIKKQGAIDALHRRIDSLIHQLGSSVWTSIKSHSRFVRLSEAISNGENILLEMQELLAALQELDPDNN